MCIKHHTHYSVKSVVVEVHQSLHCLQCVEQVDGLSKLEHHRCLSAQGIEVEGTFRDGLKHVVAKPPLCNI
jgi:hypothetical protein